MVIIVIIKIRQLIYVHTCVVQVNANGVISLSSDFDDSVAHPLPLTGTDKIIAPYWADVDITGTGDIYYRQTTDDDLLARATEQIRTAFPYSQVVSVENLLVATWDRVGYYPEGTDKVKCLYMHL